MSRFSELKAQGRFERFPTPRSWIKGAFSRGRTATTAPLGRLMDILLAYAPVRAALFLSVVITHDAVQHVAAPVPASLPEPIL